MNKEFPADYISSIIGTALTVFAGKSQKFFGEKVNVINRYLIKGLGCAWCKRFDRV